MIRVAGYGRVSTLAQALKGTSAEDQHNRIKAECKAKGYELYRFYSDEGFSGKSMENRPGLQELIRDAKDHKFDLVLFTKLDRLGRNLRDLLNVWHLLQEEHGLELVCIEDPSINTKGKFGKAMLGLLGVFAEFERDLIKERTQGGRKTKRENKTAFIGTLPLGYEWNNGIKKVKKEKELYLRIVSMYLDEHLTMKDIANRLSSEGIPPPSAFKKFKEKEGWKTKARRWNHTSVSKILRNSAYKGKAIQNRFKYKETISKGGKQYMWAPKKAENERPQEEWITVEFLPLISKQRWNNIQSRIKEQKKKPRKIHKGYEDHFLAEHVVRCGYCGSKMRKRPKVEKDGKVRFYYVCYWKGCSQKELEANGRKRCILGSVDAERVDRTVLYKVGQFITNPRKYAKEWLRNIDLEKARTTLENLLKRKANEEQDLKQGNELYATARDPETKKIYLEQQHKREERFRATCGELEKAEADWNFASNKVDHLAEFEKIAKMEKPLQRWRGYHSIQRDIKGFFKTLSFKDKKRFIEAIISPEDGGKCEIYYPTLADYLQDEDDARGIPIEELGAPMTKENPLIDITFMANLGKIQTLIAGLDRKKLLDKLNPDRVSQGKEDVGRWRRVL